jgi:nuclear GTP-binding protein
MGKNAKVGRSQNSLNPNRKAEKGGMRSKATILRLNTAKGGKPIRNKEGIVVGGTLLMNNTAGGEKITGDAGKIAPNRRWFGNTRLIGQNELDNLREKVATTASDPYTFVMRRKKIPMSLLQEENEKIAKMNILENESFQETFGSKQLRKKPKLSSAITDYESLMSNVSKSHEKMKTESLKEGCQTVSKLEEEESNKAINGGGSGGNEMTFWENNGSVEIAKDDLFAKGQSKRIWGELYKVFRYCIFLVIFFF